jgi:hypothetical protein
MALDASKKGNSGASIVFFFWVEKEKNKNINW